MFQVFITTPHYMEWSGGSPIINQASYVVARAFQYKNCEVTIPWLDTRKAKIQLPLFDPRGALHQIRANGWEDPTPYDTYLHIRYNNHPVFWGPCLEVDWLFDQGVVELRASDMSAMMQHHYFRRGDDVLNNQPSKDKGKVPVDGRGLRLMRDAADLIDGQAYPPLGVKNGINTCTNNVKRVEVNRGQEVWRAMQDMAALHDGPDFQLTPLDMDPADPNYAKLDVKNPGAWGTDRRDTVVFHKGFGRNNVKSFEYMPGGKLVTHVHTVSEDRKHRITRANVSAAQDYGVWVQWEAVDFNVSPSQAQEVLGAVGDYVLGAYSRPPKFFQFSQYPEGATYNGAPVRTFKYIDDFDIRDTVHGEMRVGEFRKSVDGTVNEVRLKQRNMSSGTVVELDVVPFVEDTLSNDEA